MLIVCKWAQGGGLSLNKEEYLKQILLKDEIWIGTQITRKKTCTIRLRVSTAVKLRMWHKWSKSQLSSSANTFDALLSQPVDPVLS